MEIPLNTMGNFIDTFGNVIVIYQLKLERCPGLVESARFASLPE